MELLISLGFTLSLGKCQLVPQQRVRFLGLCSMGMRGTPPCLRAVAWVYRLCAQYNMEVEMVWAPRSILAQQQAVALSKYEDTSHWVLNPEVYDSICMAPCLGGGAGKWQRKPTLDGFADAELTKVPGHFFSRYWCAGTAGLEALAQSWGSGDTVAGSQGELLYLFPPVGRTPGLRAHRTGLAEVVAGAARQDAVRIPEAAAAPINPPLSVTLRASFCCPSGSLPNICQRAPSGLLSGLLVVPPRCWPGGVGSPSVHCMGRGAELHAQPYSGAEHLGSGRAFVSLSLSRICL